MQTWGFRLGPRPHSLSDLEALEPQKVRTLLPAPGGGPRGPPSPPSQSCKVGAPTSAAQDPGSILPQEFEIELEGSQSLRILCYEKCYDKTKVNKDNNEIVDKIMGKGQIQVRSRCGPGATAGGGGAGRHPSHWPPCQGLGLLCLGFHAGLRSRPACWFPCGGDISLWPQAPMCARFLGFRTWLRWATHSPAGEGSLCLHFPPLVSWWLFPGALVEESGATSVRRCLMSSVCCRRCEAQHLGGLRIRWVAEGWSLTGR